MLIRTILAIACFSLLLSFGASQGQAMFHKKEERKEKALQVCLEGSGKTCQKAAEKRCKKKKGAKKKACIKASKKSCIAAAKETCKKKLG